MGSRPYLTDFNGFRPSKIGKNAQNPLLGGISNGLKRIFWRSEWPKLYIKSTSVVPATGLRRITWDVVHYWCAAGTNNAKLKSGNWLWPGPLNEPVGLPNFCERQDLNPRSQRAIGQVPGISTSFLPTAICRFSYGTWIYEHEHNRLGRLLGPTGSERATRGPAWYESRRTSG